ncbi:MAG: hypothetical protein CBC79_02140 [Gammaproteobacteria bacterium TMED119]|nr:MAG: hypothetical protein CBC79_02140 [Gammaproteobacteria bacterium TMED119]
MQLRVDALFFSDKWRIIFAGMGITCGLGGSCCSPGIIIYINVLIFGFSNSRHSDIWTMGWLSSLSMIGREWLKTYLGEYNHKLRIWECAGSHPLLAPQQATMMH